MSAENMRIVEAHLKAWSSGDAEAVVACFAPDGVFEDVALPLKEQGHAAIRETAALWLGATEIRWTPTLMFADGDRVCTESHLIVTQTGDLPGLPNLGRTAEIRALSIDEFRGGLIARHCDYWNLSTMLTQLGHLP